MIYDITIIGGGPVGLFTAFYAHLRNAKVKIIDSLHQLGGQPAMLYPEKDIFDIPAYQSISGEQLTQQLLTQLNRFETAICLNEKVQKISKDEDGHFVIETNQNNHLSKTVIIAIGGGHFKPRTLALDGMTSCNNIHYYVSNMAQYANQHLTILGGGDSAVDWALAFEPIAKSVTLVHRRNEFRALEHSVTKLKASSVRLLTPYLPIQLEKSNNQLTHLVLQDVSSKETLLHATDHLFVNYGFSTSPNALDSWQVATHKHKIMVNARQESSVPGIYAVGDCCTYDGKVELIATGFGEGPIAVNHAMHFINPKARIQPMHSTSLSLNSSPENPLIHTNQKYKKR